MPPFEKHFSLEIFVYVSSRKIKIITRKNLKCDFDLNWQSNRITYLWFIMSFSYDPKTDIDFALISYYFHSICARGYPQLGLFANGETTEIYFSNFICMRKKCMNCSKTFIQLSKTRLLYWLFITNSICGLSYSEHKL